MGLTKVVIYTDGACSGNPGPGGWAAIILCNSANLTISGNKLNTTNNRMELLAVIGGLSRLRVPCEVELYSDSAYVCNAINQKWLDKWSHTGWRRSSGGEVLNRDLWEQLINLLKIHNVRFIKVKGHSDNIFNNHCDTLARLALSRHHEDVWEYTQVYDDTLDNQIIN